ncbi:MAG: HAD-IA family hydrolase [Prevotellaceae bacterium]|jgi:beta-phosphoglucomutase-like phosphatase (HAD superfamily)|nr:HAD-IA family hydrolase [Prevotellaceae bacterium]
MTYQEAITRYLQRNGYTSLCLKAVLFDMDGILFNSMPYHAEAWHTAMAQHGLHLSREEAYLHEGRTGTDTIGIVYQRQYGKQPSPEEIKTIYADKCTAFGNYPDPEPVNGISELLEEIKECGLLRMVVTGSGQPSLIDRLTHSFPGMFQRDQMVTAFDVKQGKPNPEPYLTALKKAHLQPDQAIVVENAPMGVQAGAAAGLFTIAVNTGPIDGQLLIDAGADLLFASMPEFAKKWNALYREMTHQA